jgi:hypothetical protein
MLSSATPIKKFDGKTSPIGNSIKEQMRQTEFLKEVYSCWVSLFLDQMASAIVLSAYSITF